MLSLVGKNSGDDPFSTPYYEPGESTP